MSGLFSFLDALNIKLWLNGYLLIKLYPSLKLVDASILTGSSNELSQMQKKAGAARFIERNEMFHYIDIIRLLEVDLTLPTLVNATATGVASNAKRVKNCMVETLV